MTSSGKYDTLQYPPSIHKVATHFGHLFDSTKPLPLYHGLVYTGRGIFNVKSLFVVELPFVENDMNGS